MTTAPAHPVGTDPADDLGARRCGRRRPPAGAHPAGRVTVSNRSLWSCAEFHYVARTNSPATPGYRRQRAEAPFARHRPRRSIPEPARAQRPGRRGGQPGLRVHAAARPDPALGATDRNAARRPSAAVLDAAVGDAAARDRRATPPSGTLSQTTSEPTAYTAGAVVNSTATQASSAATLSDPATSIGVRDDRRDVLVRGARLHGRRHARAGRGRRGPRGPRRPGRHGPPPGLRLTLIDPRRSAPGPHGTDGRRLRPGPLGRREPGP